MAAAVRYRTMLGLMVWLVPALANATTFVLMDQMQLLETSDAVVVGTVTAIESAAAEPNGPIYTYVHVAPDLVLKGEIDADSIVLREPGGVVGGKTEWVFGAPEFWTGERSLLFLTQNADGSLQTTNLAMGKYTVTVDATGALMAVRHFGSGASVYVPATGNLLEAQAETQPLDPMITRLRNRARVQAAARPQPAPRLRTRPPQFGPTAIVEQQEAFTLLGAPPARWFEPDSGQPVSFLVDSTGDLTLGPDVSRAAAHAAMAAWTDVPAAKLVLADGGSGSPVPWRGCGVSEISFNDPGHEIGNPSGCGGILAIGGFCTGTDTTTVHGRTFYRISSAKVILNDGWGKCDIWNQCNVEEVLTHELGHAIGFGHSGDSSATMAAYAHFDGRCAGLKSDDVAAVTYVYPAVGGPVPTTPSSATATPSARTATPTARTATPSTSPPSSGTPTPTPPATPESTAVPVTPMPTPQAGLRCAGVNKVSVLWSAKRPAFAKVLVSATRCPPPPRCDTPFAGGAATLAPAVMSLSGATAGGFARLIDQPASNRGGCPGGSDTYYADADRLRLVYGASGRTTVVAKVNLPLAVAGPPALSLPLSFTVRDSSGYGLDVSASTCFTKQNTTGTTVKCF